MVSRGARPPGLSASAAAGQAHATALTKTTVTTDPGRSLAADGQLCQASQAVSGELLCGAGRCSGPVASSGATL